MNLIELLNRARRMPLDERYACLMSARGQFKPRSIDHGHLQREISLVLHKRIRRDNKARKSAA